MRRKRTTFPPGWKEALEGLEDPYWRIFNRGPFEAHVDSEAGVAACKLDLRLPDGRAYRGTLHAHTSVEGGGLWYEVFVSALEHATAARDDVLNADGAMPAVAPDRFNLWPCQIKLSPSPLASRGER